MYTGWSLLWPGWLAIAFRWCEHNGVVLSLVKELNLPEDTSCAYKLKGVNTTVKNMAGWTASYGMDV